MYVLLEGGLGLEGGLTTPPPPHRRPNSADLADLFRRFVGFLNFADLFCRFFGFCDFAHSFCRLVGASGIVKPSRPDTLEKAKQPSVLKNITVAQRVEKYSSSSSGKLCVCTENQFSQQHK